MIEQIKINQIVLLVTVIQLRMKNKAKKLVDRQRDEDSMKKSQLLIVLFAANRDVKVMTLNCIG